MSAASASMNEQILNECDILLDRLEYVFNPKNKNKMELGWGDFSELPPSQYYTPIHYKTNLFNEFENEYFAALQEEANKQYELLSNVCDKKPVLSWEEIDELILNLDKKHGSARVTLFETLHSMNDDESVKRHPFITPIQKKRRYAADFRTPN